MEYTIINHDDFDLEFDALEEDVQNKLLAIALVLKIYGPTLGRPYVDTLYDSKHSNMKEIRFSLNEDVWRFAFAFDTKRKAVVLCGGMKSGSGNEKRFYKSLIKLADKRFSLHLKKHHEVKG